MLLLVILGAMAAGGVLGLTSLAIHSRMIEDVNQKLPADQRFGDAWWGPGRTMRLGREYRRLYPDGRLLRRQRTVLAIAALLWLAAVICLFR